MYPSVIKHGNGKSPKGCIEMGKISINAGSNAGGLSLAMFGCQGVSIIQIARMEL